MLWSSRSAILGDSGAHAPLQRKREEMEDRE